MCDTAHVHRRVGASLKRAWRTGPFLCEFGHCTLCTPVTALGRNSKAAWQGRFRNSADAAGAFRRGSGRHSSYTLTPEARSIKIDIQGGQRNPPLASATGSQSPV